MTRPPIHAVIFDCDGVLVDSEPAAFDLLADDLTRHGLTLPRDRMERDFLGGTIRGVWLKARALGATFPDDWVEDFYERLYARLAQGTSLIPGIEAVLDRLDAHRFRYAVGSNGSDRKMEVTLGQHPAFRARFQGRLFSGQTLGTPKPAPDLFLHAARAMKVKPQNCAVIDDSPTGCLAARNAGMACFGFAAHDDGKSLSAVGATVFHAMSELTALLRL